MNTVDRKLNAKPVVPDAGYAQDDGREIDLLELFFRLLEKAGWIAGIAVAAAVVAVLYTVLFVTPAYRATAKLYVLNSSDSAINLNDLNIGEKLADDYVQVFNNYEVYEMAQKFLNPAQYEMYSNDKEVLKLLTEKTYTLSGDFSEVLEMLDINVISNTRIIEINVTSEDKKEAMVVANVYALAAQEFIASVMRTDRPSMFEPARIPEMPSSPNVLKNAVLAFVICGVLAAAFFVIQFILDDRVRTAEQLQKQLGLPTLGLMPIQASERRSGRLESGKKVTE